ncbi:MAG: NAD(P)H-dependent flavin oxidoreductase [Pontibacterium sp.]
MNKITHQAFLAVDLPVIQAPMAGVQDSALTLAVAEGGGLGSLPCAMLSPQQIEDEVRLLKARSDKPFNLNFFCHQMPAYDEARQSAWRTLLRPYFDELLLDCPDQPGASSRLPFNHEIADRLEPFKPEVISFHFGVPEHSVLKRLQSWGSTILSTATTVNEALFLEAKGIDGIIAQGLEAGGHRGLFLDKDLSTQMGTLSLLPQVLNKVSVPVIAAGGIADAAGVKAVLDLGAVAAQVGTAYLLCDEAKTSPLHRAALQSQAASHTTLTTLFSGRPARGIVNRVIRELGAMPDAVVDFPYAASEITLLRQAAEACGSDDFSPLWCGQNATGCRSVSAAELTRILGAEWAGS